MAAPLAVYGQAWPRTKIPSFSHARRPGPSHNSQWGCRPWGLEDGQPPRCGGIYSANQALLRCYEPTTAYLNRFYISFLQCILPSYSFTAYDSFSSSFLAKPSKGTAGGLAFLGSSDKSRSTRIKFKPSCIRTSESALHAKKHRIHSSPLPSSRTFSSSLLAHRYRRCQVKIDPTSNRRGESPVRILRILEQDDFASFMPVSAPETVPSTLDVLRRATTHLPSNRSSTWTAAILKLYLILLRMTALLCPPASLL